MKEMRGLMAVVRRQVTEYDCCNARMLVLGDNLGLVLSVPKGRCQSAQVLMPL